MTTPGALIEQLAEAGLTGRGGAAFSTAIKVRAATTSKASLIINACDGEFGAAKDGWVVEHHLSELVAGARLLGASQVIATQSSPSAICSLNRE